MKRPKADSSIWLQGLPLCAFFCQFDFQAQALSIAGGESPEDVSRSLLILYGLLAMVVGLAFWLWRPGWSRLLYRDRLAGRLFVAFVASILLVTLLTWLAEKARNPNFSSFSESFWSITVYIFSGLEDRSPVTALGRFSATLGLLIGPLFFASMTGLLAKTLIDPERRMPQNLKDHYLILNWSSRAIDLVRELHHPLIRKREGNSVIVVLADDESLSLRHLKEVGSGTDELFEDFFLCVGDPTKERALRNANAQDARTILILADEREGAHADENTIRSVVMLRRIARQEKLEAMHVVTELVNPDNEEVLDEIGRDFPGQLERVSELEIRTYLMAQAVLNEGVVEFYTDLLRVTGDTNEVYSRPIPESAVGMSFRELGALLLTSRATDPMIAVGVQRKSEGRARIFCNPRPQAPGSILEKGDRLVLLAYEPPPQDVLFRFESGLAHA